MPYVITTRREGPYWGPKNIISESRRAVATLEEARDYADKQIGDRFGLASDPVVEAKFCQQATALPESGGTIGPLPDGIVIEVERVNSWDLANTGVGGDTLAEIIDAYNARQRVNA